MESVWPENKRRWIASQQLFEHVPAAIVDRLTPHFEPRSFAAQSMVMTELRSSNALCLIVHGTVKISLERGGRRTLLNICGPGEILGEMNLLDGQGHSADIETLEETAIYWIDGRIMAEYLEQDVHLGLNLARIVSRRLRLATSRIEALTMLDLSGRLAHQLLSFAREYGKPTREGHVLIPLHLSQSDLASLLGASRVKVNQGLAEFRKAGWIEVARNNHITILKPQALAQRSVEGIAAPGTEGAGSAN